MKYLFGIILLSISTFNSLLAQGNEEISTFICAPISNHEIAFKIKNDKSSLFVNSMFKNYPKIRRTGFTHIFKNIVVPGVEGILELTIHEGIYGTSTDNGLQSYYFHTFANEKYKKESIDRMTENEGFGILIYVKKDKKSYITLDQEAKNFIDFIQTVIKS